jgi:hypothetical protein
MKSIFILLLLIPLQSSAQDLLSISTQTNIGQVVFSDNYIQFDNNGVQRSVLTHTGGQCYDLYAWKWSSNKSDFKFELGYSEKIYLIRYKRGTDKMTGRFRVYKYQINFTKDDFKE